jgi:transcriptional regulator with XRE-family HTH domain
MNNPEFPRTLSLLRQERGVSQRAAAQDLGISQALLSHYENGVREPGLSFVVKACDYYAVSADFLLGRTMSRDGTTISTEDLHDASQEKDNVLRGSVMATLSKKLLVNSISVIFDLLGKLGSREAVVAAAEYIGTAIYRVFRMVHQANRDNNPDFFTVPPRHFAAGLANADMTYSEMALRDALAACKKEEMPPMSHTALSQAYPGTYQSLLQIIHSTGERINRHTALYRGDGQDRRGQ